MASYQEQIERAKRSYDRLQEINDGRKHDRSTEFSRDDLYGFFQNCYHVKDWILSDSSLPIADKKKVVEQFVNESRPLSVCADLCNATKHMELRDPPRSDQHPKFTAAHYGYAAPAGTITVNYEISTRAGKLDAFDLAGQCLAEWDRFFRLTPSDWAELGKRYKRKGK